MIRPEAIREAEAEAERFLVRVTELRESKEPEIYGGPLHAALRRASMDLTRSLAKLRSR